LPQIKPVRNCERLSNGGVRLSIEEIRERNGLQIVVNGESRERNNYREK